MSLEPLFILLKCQVEIGTPVVWRTSGQDRPGCIEEIQTDAECPVIVKIGGSLYSFTDDGKWATNESLTLSLAEVSPPRTALENYWVQFMCANMAADYSVELSATYLAFREVHDYWFMVCKSTQFPSCTTTSPSCRLSIAAPMELSASCSYSS